MILEKTAKVLGVTAVMFALSGCETLNLTGSDDRFERVEVSEQECQDRGGTTIVGDAGEKSCRIPAAAVSPEAVPVAAASSAGGTGAAAAIAGLGLVLVMAISDSSTGTR